MSDLPTLVTAVTSNADLMNEIYKDAFSPSVRHVGDTLAVCFEYVGRKATKGLREWIARDKAEAVARDLKLKIETIPPERLVEPNMRHFGAVVDALPFTIDEPDLRELFINLLTASMDSERTDGIHIGFVECIKQMEPLDARLLHYIWTMDMADDYFHVEFVDKIESGMELPMDSSFPPHYILYEPDKYAYKRIGASIDNLQRLGMLNLNWGSFSGTIGELPDWHEIIPLLEREKEILQAERPGCNISYDRTTHNVCKLTQFGVQFAEACMK